MKTLLRLHLFLAIAFVLCAIGIVLFQKHLLPDPPLLQRNAEFQRNVESIKDIEHLRKVVYTVVIGTDKSVVAMKGVVDSAVNLLFLLMLVAACGFASCYLLVRRLSKVKTLNRESAL